MELRIVLLKFIATIIALTLPVIAQSNQQTPVVATFSILGDMVERIGGEHVNVETLVGPGGDAHVYQPTPADAREVSEAKVLIVNGLEFEGWLNRLIDASDFSGKRIVATAGIQPISLEEEEHHEDEEHAKTEEHEDEEHSDDKDHHHGAFDPHAWQSLTNAINYVDNITAALSQADPSNASDFYQNRASYVAEIKALNTEISDSIAMIPESKRTVVTSHDAFGYFAKSFGLTFEAPQGMSTESEASAQDVAGLIKQIRDDNISAVFVETITDNRLLEQIARETGASIGGTLYSDALSGPEGPASSYLDMMHHNATTITKALNF